VNESRCRWPKGGDTLAKSRTKGRCVGERKEERRVGRGGWEVCAGENRGGRRLGGWIEEGRGGA